ncbi:DNA mismatch repair protein MutT, partial [Propionibacterium freudenreichii]|nr:DNA mismatch repair protein MutT [Propionibacterium freudenreichii]
MHVIGVQRVDKAPVVRLPVGHGEDPRVLLWHRGWVVSRWLSATGADEELVVTAQVRQRTATS